MPRVERSTKKDYLGKPGQIPLHFMIHLIRFAHITDTCMNSDKHQGLCPGEIPNALFVHTLQVEL